MSADLRRGGLHGRRATGTVHGKGNKDRTVPLAPGGNLVRSIEEADGWLFPNGLKNPTLAAHITPGHVSKLLCTLLPKPWTAHTLRHRFGTKAYANSRDLLAVSRLLDHASTVTTLTYVLLPDEHMVDAVKGAASIGGQPADGWTSDVAA